MPGPLAAVAPYAIPALTSLISGLFGAKGEKDRMSKLREEIERLLSPESVGSETNRFFDIFRNSPMYSALRARAMTGAGSLANSINARAQRAGLGNSGLAAVAEPLARSSFGNTFANIDSDLFSQALSAARSSLSARAGIAQQTQSPGILAGGLGRGIESFLPYLYRMMSMRGDGNFTRDEWNRFGPKDF